MAKQKLDANITKTIAVIMRNFSREQIIQVMDYIQNEVATDQQRKENITDWQTTLNNIKLYRRNRADKNRAKKLEKEF